MPLPADDLAWLVQDSGGELAVFGGAQTYAHSDPAQAEIAERLQVRVPVYRLSFAAGALPGLKAGSTLMVGGLLHHVKDAGEEQLGDGLESWFAVRG